MKIASRIRAAFTLIELLVVITIIAVLAALLVPVLQTGIKAAHSTQCTQNLRNLIMASLRYANDHHQDMPKTDFTVSPTVYWFAGVASYLYDPSIQPNTLDGTFRCPDGSGYKTAGKGFSNALWTTIDYVPVLGYANSTARLNLYQVRPTTTAYLMDGANYGGSAGIWNDASFTKLVPSSSWRHKGGINVAFCDGHVAYTSTPSFASLVQP